MRAKRLSALVLALILALALTAPALAAPGSSVSAAAGAAVSSFHDITDPTVGRNADLLRFMGVVKGTGGDSFNPAGTLTRAEFCAMLIRVTGKEDREAGYRNRTIFTDVTSTHWARGYVNLAAAPKKEDEPRLIAGMGDGTFKPDAAIDYAQAATILIRALGYSDEEVGSVWPADHIAKAAELGLSDGVNASSGPITRAQAAQLFVNLLTCRASDGNAYYATLGKAEERVILFGADGKGGVRTSAGEFLLPAQLPASMDMQQGVLVTKGDKVVVFLPNASGVAITLSDKATEKYLKTASATYTVSDTARVYVPDEDGPEGSMKETAYADLRGQLTAGAQLTAYFTGSKISELCLRYAGSSLAARGDAVVVTGTASETMFYQLTGGATGMRIVKDGSPISMGDVKTNDVVTYNAVTNTLTVSGLRISTIYAGAEPNFRNPERILIPGLEVPLEVLPCAMDSLSRFSLGDAVTLLLTGDGKVAGVISTSGRSASTLVGVWNGSSVSVPLSNGEELTFTASSSISSGQLVTISAYSRKEASVSRVTNRTIPGSFNVKGMTLGGYAVAANVRVYERCGASGPATPLKLSDLTVDTVPADKIAAFHLNTSDMVDALILDNVTGNGYTYGILREGTMSGGTMGDISVVNRTVIVENSGNRAPTLEDNGTVTGMAFTNGAFGGVLVEGNRVADLIYLTAVRNVSVEDFFTVDGVQYVSAGGRVHRIAEQVECYNNATKTWITGENPLGLAKTYGSAFTVYVDPISSTVRVVIAS